MLTTAERMEHMPFSGIRVVMDKATQMDARGEHVIHLELGRPDFDTPQVIKEAAYKSLEKGNVFYTSNYGSMELRTAVAEKLRVENNIHYDPSEILITVGVGEGTFNAFGAYLEEGDEVLIPDPVWLNYIHVPEYFGAKAVPYTLKQENDYQIDMEELESKITDRTKMVVIISPNNPTGVVYSLETLTKMADIMRAKEKELGTTIVLLSDEPYRELAYDGVDVPYVTNVYDNTVICYSYSKSLSLPGERIGYLVIPDALKDSGEVFNAATIANRVLGCVNAPSLMQRVILRCLDAKVNLEAYDRNRNLLYNGLKDLGFECIKPQGAFYLFVKSPEADEKKFCGNCKKYNILVVPGTSFACPGYVRISYCVSYEQIERSLPAFAKVAADYGLTK